MNRASSLSEFKGKWVEGTLLGKEIGSIPFSLRADPLVEAMSCSFLTPLNTEGLTLKELCEIAILSSRLGGRALAEHLSTLCDFPTLFSSPDTYDPFETKNTIDLLLFLLNKKNEPPKTMTPYFKALTAVASLKEEGTLDFPIANVSSFGPLKMAFIAEGAKASLGALHVQGIEVPAFGPHLHPLNEPSFFGADVEKEASSWGRVSADKEIWFEYARNSSGFEIQMFGHTPQKKVSFTFYVKGDRAEVDQKIFVPKTLTRFSGKISDVLFTKDGTQFSIRASSRVKTELIPLGGDRSFWGSDFLLAFEIPSFEGRLGFEFT